MMSSIPYAKILLNLARSGWLLRGVPNFIAETVAEHIFLTAYICIELCCSVQGVDIGKVILYSLVHDIGEAFIGDIIKPVSVRLGKLKESIEENYIKENIDNELIVELYKRYTSQTDFEAKLTRLCNYISTFLIGIEYKNLGYRVDDIIDNIYNEIEKISKELNIENIVKNLITKLIK